MKYSDYEVYKESPFKLEGIEIKSRLSKVRGELMSSVSTGELFDLRSLPKQENIETDTKSYRKVYEDSFPTIKNFSIPELKVWCYIVQKLKPHKHTVEINYKELVEYTGYKTSPLIYIGLGDLIKDKYIAKSDKKWVYYINSNKIFNGDRLKNYNKSEE